MGMRLFSSSSSSTVVETVFVKDPRDPDPFRFKVTKLKKVGEVFISMVNYPNCTNFEGNKILVSTFDPRKTAKLDPHFSSKSGLLARFIPTDVGWEMAVAFAEMIIKESE